MSRHFAIAVVLVLLTLLCSCLQQADSFASWMTSGEYCDRALKEGEVIMNELVAIATGAELTKSIRVLRDKEVLVSGVSQYNAGESLFVQLLDGDELSKKGQFVFEATGGTFPRGGCEGRRIADSNDVDFLMPSEEYLLDTPVTVWAGWAPEHGQVLLVPVFTLLPPNGRGEAEAVPPLVAAKPTFELEKEREAQPKTPEEAAFNREAIMSRRHNRWNSVRQEVASLRKADLKAEHLDSSLGERANSQEEPLDREAEYNKARRREKIAKLMGGQLATADEALTNTIANSKTPPHIQQAPDSADSPKAIEGRVDRHKKTSEYDPIAYKTARREYDLHKKKHYTPDEIDKEGGTLTLVEQLAEEEELRREEDDDSTAKTYLMGVVRSAYRLLPTTLSQLLVTLGCLACVCMALFCCWSMCRRNRFRLQKRNILPSKYDERDDHRV